MARKKKTVRVVEVPEDSVPRRPSEEPDDPEGSAGQSGDLQGLSDQADADSESVSELLEEGQFYEAEVVSGVENAPPADAGPVKTHKRREDDLPPEYTDVPPDEPKE